MFQAAIGTTLSDSLRTVIAHNTVLQDSIASMVHRLDKLQIQYESIPHYIDFMSVSATIIIGLLALLYGSSVFWALRLPRKLKSKITDVELEIGRVNGELITKNTELTTLQGKYLENEQRALKVSNDLLSQAAELKRLQEGIIGRNQKTNDALCDLWRVAANDSDADGKYEYGFLKNSLALEAALNGTREDVLMSVIVIIEMQIVVITNDQKQYNEQQLSLLKQACGIILRALSTSQSLYVEKSEYEAAFRRLRTGVGLVMKRIDP